MTIIAQLNSLSDAYAGMAALRTNAIPPALSKQGDYLFISVDDDFAPSAREILSGDGRFEQAVNTKSVGNLSIPPGFEDCNG